MVHSKKLEETVLWKIDQEKADLSGKRCDRVKEVYEAAAEYLIDVWQKSGRKIPADGIFGHCIPFVFRKCCKMKHGRNCLPGVRWMWCKKTA